MGERDLGVYMRMGVVWETERGGYKYLAAHKAPSTTYIPSFLFE